MDPDEFDLIPQGSRSSIFKVTFDYYTPRSHFAISERHHSDSRRVGQDFNKIPPDVKREMIKVVNQMFSEYNLEGVFSIHCGSWTTTKETFHAHICIEVTEYIKLFHKKENEIPNWPSENYVTREWKASQDPNEYELNVRGYPYKGYFRDECKGVREFITKQRRREQQGRQQYKRICPTTDARNCYEGFLIVYHPTEPRVGFVLQTRMQVSEDDQLKAMNAMYKFSEASELTSLKKKGPDKGCHICLVLDEQTRGFPIGPSQRLLGFLQVSATKFYKDFCPEDIQQSWFDQFRSREDYKVYT